MLAFLPGESHGQKSLASYSSEGFKEMDMTEATEHLLCPLSEADLLFLYLITIFSAQGPVTCLVAERVPGLKFA